MKFSPNWVSTPGNTVLDILEEKNLSIDEFAELISEPLCDIQELISGNLRIESSLAVKLSKSLGFSDVFWLKRDEIYSQRCMQFENEWLSKLPVNEMKKRKLIDTKLSVREACFRFFGINNLSEWNQKYRNQISNLAFRKSSSFETDMFSIAVWVRQAEIATEHYFVAKWDRELFEKKLLSDIKPLSKVKNPTDFLPKLIKICANCGVKLAIVPALGKNRASGATKFIGEHALMILSFRHLTDDHFWFTFFHEAGHLVLHSENRRLRIDTENLGSVNNEDEEYEANLFAENCLIPYEIQHELEKLNGNKRNIISFAIKAGISPGIVVGQMQFKKIISFNYLNTYKRRFSWQDIQLGINNVSF